MICCPLGKTGLQVRPTSFGAGEIGILPISSTECDRLLNGVLDAGINLIHTGECYGDSEEKIGRALAHRRSEFVLVTKCGHTAEPDDPPEWTPELIEVNIQRSLKRLRCDCVDVLLLHSCTPQILREGAVVAALQTCKQRGLTRFIGYSGDAEKADAALGMDCFDVLEISVNLCDQQAIERHLPRAMEQNLGVIAKRPLANACWRDLQRLEGYMSQYAAGYAERLGRLGFSPAALGFDGDWVELALRFALYVPGVATGITGSRSLTHVQQNLSAAERGPLPVAVYQAIRATWQAVAEADWEGCN